MKQYERVQRLRRWAWNMQSRHCHYCGEAKPWEETTLDHKQPRALGGKTNIQNCVMACLQCNRTKANTPYEVFMAKTGMRALEATG